MGGVGVFILFYEKTARDDDYRLAGARARVTEWKNFNGRGGGVYHSFLLVRYVYHSWLGCVGRESESAEFSGFLLLLLFYHEKNERQTRANNQTKTKIRTLTHTHPYFCVAQ